MEEVERARCDVCAYNERGLYVFESVLVDEEKVAAVSGSWAVVVKYDVEEATCTLLLQLFWAAAPVKTRQKGWKVDVSQALNSDGGQERNAEPRVGSCGPCGSNETRTCSFSAKVRGGRTRLEEPKGRRHREDTESRRAPTETVKRKGWKQVCEFLASN